MNVFTVKELWSFRFFVGGFFAFLLYLCVVSIYPWKPFEVNSKELEVTNFGKEVIAGEVLNVQVKETKYWKGSMLVATELVNHKRDTLAPYWPDRELGYKEVETGVVIPLGTQPGKYRLYRTFTTPITNFPKVDASVEIWSEEFEVMAREVPQGPKGDTGATGKQGHVGIQGSTGATGKQGIQGIKGSTGEKGGFSFGSKK